mmetsp:Transcript_9779/g.22090  ORF Transcript_9779/g.22090 Transcript_9779/m.22090 type:complete len:362 (+) Transcript_9779:1822-2907(+)
MEGEGEHGHAHDQYAHVRNAFVRLVLRRTEPDGQVHGRAGVATRSHEACDDAHATRTRKWNDAVRRTLRCLHEQREEDHEGDRSRERFVQLSHANAHHTFQKQQGPEIPESSTHSKLPRGPVGQPASNRTSEQVHQAERRRDGASNLEVDAEIVEEVRGGNLVHRQLDAEAERVEDDEHPHAIVEHAELEDLEHTLVLELPSLLHETVLPTWHVLSEVQDGGTSTDLQRAGDEHRVAPAPEDETTAAVDGGEQERHEELGDTSTEVSPPTGGGVRESDDAVVEHDGIPVLARHERSEGDADEHARDEEVRTVVRQSETKRRRREDQKQARHAVARSQFIADGSHRDAHEHDGGDRGDARIR